MKNFYIFLDIDGVIATRNALDQLWGSITGFNKGEFDNFFEYFNTIKGYKRPLCSMYHWPFDEQCIFNYHTLQYRIFTELEMIPTTVLCSTWRMHYNSLYDCKVDLAYKKLNLLFLQGFTGHGKDRGNEIKEYIKIFNINNNFIVIDDDCEYDIMPTIESNHCITPKFQTGFNQECLEESINKIKYLLI